MHAWLAYMTVFIPGVTYSAPTTSLTEAQCTKLEKIVKPALVKKLGLYQIRSPISCSMPINNLEESDCYSCLLNKA
eukprot:scaffold85253_cov35-Attheya_sp.AAC.1